MPYILSIDQGTTGTTVMLVNSLTLLPVAKVNREFTQFFPQSSWVEHDLNEIWESVKQSCLELFQNTKINTAQIQSIGITNQRETICAFNKSGEALARAIVWQDRRTQDYCQKMSPDYQSRELHLKTGLPLDPYFSASKINWLLHNNDNIKAAREDNNLYFSTIDSFLLYKLTGAQSFLTDATNASRTMLMNLKSCEWDQDLLNFFNIPEVTLPKICPTLHCFGKTQDCDFLPDNISINCLIGDQQSALLGQGCINKGEIKCTYGTGAFLLLNTGENIEHSDNGLLTTVALKTNATTTYALEGSTYIAGAAIQWLRDNLSFFHCSQEVEQFTSQIENLDEMNDLYFFPFFTGIGTPYWKSHAKAAIVGMTRSTQKKHIALAALEGIALSINDAIETFRKDSQDDITTLRVDGGASQNDRLLQTQSEFSNLQIERPDHIDTTALGAAYGAYLSFNNLELSSLKSILGKNTKTFKKEANDYTKNKKDFWKSYIKKNF